LIDVESDMSGDTGRPLDGRTILVVEDEYLIARDICRVLEAEGAGIVGPVGDVEAGRSALAAGRIDCAVLDVNLRGERSFALADILLRQRIPVVVASGYDRAALPGALRGAGHLTKPLDLRRLVEEVTMRTAAG
jgi:DNA-binding response OmpR family regulator